MLRYRLRRRRSSADRNPHQRDETPSLSELCVETGLAPSLLEIFYGCVIFSGLTSESNSSPVRCFSFNAASRRLECSTCAVWAICAALSYPTFGASAVTSISEFLTYQSTFARSTSMPLIMYSTYPWQASAISVTECRKL